MRPYVILKEFRVYFFSEQFSLYHPVKEQSVSKYKINFDYRQQQARTMNEAECQRQSQEESLNEKLLRGLKKEVKHLMEESVMLKCVHEDSSSITSLCLSVDACLSYGLKRRALGLFKTRYEKRTSISNCAFIFKICFHFQNVH